MIVGVTHLTMEADLDRGIAVGVKWGFELQFRDEVALPAAFENIEEVDHTLPLALMVGSRGIRLEVVHHRRRSGAQSAYTGVFGCVPSAHARTATGRPWVRELLVRSDTLSDPLCVTLATPHGEGWFDAASPSRSHGLAGVLCSVSDVPAEAEFWSLFARVRWADIRQDAAWGAIPSPVPETRCRFLIASSGTESASGHAMNDAGFPSMGVFSTSIDADCARAVTAGAKIRSEPIRTMVGGRCLRMALIETPGGAPVELLSVVNS